MAQTNENVISTEELFVRQATRRGGGQVSRGEIEQTSKASITIHEEAIKTSPNGERLKKFRKAAAEAAAAAAEGAAAAAEAAAAGNSTTQEAKFGSNQQSIKMPDSVEQGVNKLRDAERRLVPAPDDNSARSSRSKIQSVSRILRSHSNLDKYFEPRVLAMGPIHHDKCIEAEKLKYKLAADFVKDSGCTYDQLYKKILDRIAEIKDCYDNEATKCYDDDETLAWMLFIDGCSTLQFMHKIDRLEEFGMNRTQAAFAQLDLFLLENQLPYQVLELLMSSTIKEEELFRSIQNFVELQIIAAATPLDRERRKPLQAISKIRAHAQAIRMSYLFKEAIHHPSDYLRPTHHLLDFLRERMLGPTPKVINDQHRKEDNSPSFRNAQELKAAGVHFRRSKTSSLWDISFTSVGFVGFLHLPPINEDAMSLFLNLIAYEMCPDFLYDFGVTSYFSFLSSLIAHPNDAKQLRSARILCNLRGTNVE